MAIILTKKRRHAAYVRALEILKESRFQRGLCGIMEDAAYELELINWDGRDDVNDPYTHMDKYRELYAQKPKDLPHTKVFWWDIDDVVSRINALKTAIELSK